MKFTDIFIRRPVLATVLSLLILLLGLRSITGIGLREYPKTVTTVISVSTAYPGASARVMQGFITQPLQKAIASADGIEYITSSSAQSSSKITVHIRLNYNPTKALTDITAKVNQVRNILPRASQAPIISESKGRRTALMYISFYSKTFSRPAIADYLTRVVVPKLQSVPGVAQANILGSAFAMRIWLDPRKLAAYGITPQQVTQAIQNNNFIAAVGQTKGPYVAINVNARTDLHTAREFRNLVVATHNDSLIRLGQLGKVDLGAASYGTEFFFGGKPAVAIAIDTTPTANPLSVADGIVKLFPAIKSQLPAGMNARIPYDGSRYIRSSITEVIKTLGEAAIIVIAVMFLFLGSLRSVTIAMVTIPLSLIGTIFVMLLLGYSLNLLTFLAMVMAIGLVVDDAIVVVENIHRHLEQGKTRLQAALVGAREIGGPVIAMTLTLAAVYAPIGFLGGITGTLFREFAFTLATTVIISGFLALTLAPMMCSRMLRPPREAGRFAHWLDHSFERIKNTYNRWLHHSLNHRLATLLVGATILIVLFPLYSWSKHELAPKEDQGFVIAFAQTPPTATIDYSRRYALELQRLFTQFPQRQYDFIVAGRFAGGGAFGGLVLKPWDERSRSAMSIQAQLAREVRSIAGLQTYVVLPPSLPGNSGGAPVQFVISTTNSYRELAAVARELSLRAQKSGLFIFANQNLKYDMPELELTVDRSKAQTLGLSMAAIGQAMGTLLGGGYVNFFSAEGYSYKVIPQVIRKYRFNPENLTHYYVRSAAGTMIPLSEVVKLKQVTVPPSLAQFDQLNAATITGVPRPGVSLARALSYLNTQLQDIAPTGYFVNYQGESRQFKQEGSALAVTFLFALIIIYLVLSALFESFRDPLIILVSVPMAAFGALLLVYFGLTSINIYTQVGLVTLIGLISKHGILITRFANDLQREKGLSRRAAVEQAAAIRLRPILMTTAAMVLAVVPLIAASGAGAGARFAIGLVIASGMSIGTLFTLFMVPMVYTFIAENHRPQAKK